MQLLRLQNPNDLRALRSLKMTNSCNLGLLTPVISTPRCHSRRKQQPRAKIGCPGKCVSYLVAVSLYTRAVEAKHHRQAAFGIDMMESFLGRRSENGVGDNATRMSVRDLVWFT